MIIVDKSKLAIGIALVLTFLVVLVMMVSPIVGKQTGLQYADDLFNELTKQSSYRIPGVMGKAVKFEGENFQVRVKTKDQREAGAVALILAAAGARASVGEREVSATGDLGRVATTALQDADLVFKGRDEKIRARYGLDGRTVVYCWWLVFREERRQYLRENKGPETDFVSSVITKGLEPAYNFVSIKPARVSERAGVAAFLLVLYVVYTLWWGVGIMYTFEGIGLAATRSTDKRET